MKIVFTPGGLELLAANLRFWQNPPECKFWQLCAIGNWLGEICDRTPCDRGNVSKHLRLMKDAGVEES